MLAEGCTLAIAASFFAVFLFAWPLLYKCLQVSRSQFCLNSELKKSAMENSTRIPFNSSARAL